MDGHLWQFFAEGDNRPVVCGGAGISRPEGAPWDSSDPSWYVSVLDNDEYSETLNAVKEDDPTNGTVTLDQASGTFVYTPDPGYVGADSFTYRACDASEPDYCSDDPATVSIVVEDDAEPSISINDATGTEIDGYVEFTVTLSNASASEVSVDVTTADGTAISPDDYAAASGTITFPPGEPYQGLDVNLVDDGIDEYDEQFIVNLSNATEATIGNSQAYGGIYGEQYLTLDLPPKELAEPIAPLTLAEVKPLVPEAVARWVAAGSDGRQLRTALENVQFVIMDLPDSRLAAAHTGHILLDVDAAGYGWFVDATSSGDDEFQRVISPSERQAGKGSPAAGHVDLLTAITHELGHVLGLPDLPVELVPHNIMTDTIGLGTRRSPIRHHVARDHADTRSESRSATDVVFQEVGRREELRSNRGERETGPALAKRLLTEEEFVWFLYELLRYDHVR